MTTRLTDNENTVLAGFNDKKRPYSFWDGGIVAGEDSGTWSLSFVEEMAAVLNKPTKSARGVFASLIKKDIFITHHHEADGDSPAQEWVQLTEKGVEAIADLKFESEALEFDMEEEAPDEEVEAPIKKAKAKKIEAVKASTAKRFSHANCDHETHGAEGKIARAKCRRQHAAEGAELAAATK